jgi:hypothetical protein
MSMTLEERSMNRGMHIYFMGVQPVVADALPTEELRLQIDGLDTQPDRRNFARAVDLFERELRLPAPGVDWRTLTRGRIVRPAIMRGMPSMTERLDRRAYNEYCEPSKDFQPDWNRETARIERLTDRIQRHAKLEMATACFAGATIGIGGLGLYVASLFIGPVAYPVIGAYVVACVLAIAWAMHTRARRIQSGHR